MDLAVYLAYAPWVRLDEQLQLAKLADELGFHSAWVAETWGQDATAILGALAVSTEHIRLGAAIMQIPARQPTTAASAISTVDQLSGGRAILGLGLSGPQVSEGWYGVPFLSALGRTREYIDIVRKALAHEPVEYGGKHWQLPVRDAGLGLGKPLKMIGRPVQDTIPVYLGVMGEKTVRQAGQIADGWLPAFYSPAHAQDLNRPLLEGIASAGRSREDVKISPTVPVALAETREAARDLLRPILTWYFGAMGAKDKNFYIELATRYGFGDVATQCQLAFLAGDRMGAAAALTPEVIDMAAIAATPSTLETQLGAYADAGVDTLIALPFGDRPSLLKALASHLP
ncbi:MAG: LLM class flavin-dependent oxidoreductase [Candidatus Nanopelagicales bacterium]|nr:LLM class flavin-dependent oxidoreductase [Candidatus Nanopelagicales bacterium]